MNLSSLTLLKVLLDSSAKKEELIPFFSEIDLDDFEKITTDAITFSAQDFLYEHLLGEVHYSWFLPTLKSYSSKEASLFLLSLPSAFGEKISPLLKLPLIDAKLAKTAKRYFRKLLLDSLLGEEKEILPKNYLPPSSLNVLASFTKNQLLRIIDLLALYDLAIEMKKIVATATLKKILRCFD